VEDVSLRTRFVENDVTKEWLRVKMLEPGTKHVVKVTPKNGPHEGTTVDAKFTTSKPAATNLTLRIRFPL